MRHEGLKACDMKARGVRHEGLKACGRKVRGVWHEGAIRTDNKKPAKSCETWRARVLLGEKVLLIYSDSLRMSICKIKTLKAIKALRVHVRKGLAVGVTDYVYT